MFAFLGVAKLHATLVKYTSAHLFFKDDCKEHSDKISYSPQNTNYMNLIKENTDGELEVESVLSRSFKKLRHLMLKKA